MSLQKRLSVLAAIAALSACAGTSPGTRPAATDTAAAAPASPVARLYQRLDQDSARYSDGLALARAGNTAQAQAEIKTALDDLRAAATQCARVAGCDQQRFVSGMDALLRQGAGGAANANVGAEGDTTGATPDATMEAGESSPVVAEVPELGRSVALLKGRDLSDIIALNGPVKAALEEWLTQYRPNLVSTYENYEYMRYLMWPEYERAGLPEALLFGMMAKESGGKVHAVSRSGASGPLQFMYATGQRFGLGTIDGFDQRFDAKLSARANAAYLNEQLAIFNNNLELVIGAYNGGEGAMQRRAGAGAGALSFWDPKVYYGVSQETREYVPMVLAAAWLFMHPDRYNLSFPKIAGRPGNIVLKRPTSLAELSVCFGQAGGIRDGWFRTLRNLNPQLDPQRAEPAGAHLSVPLVLEKAYPRDCANGRWPTLAAELHAAFVPTPPPVALTQTRPTVASRAAPPARAKVRTYTVRRGDSLSSIARKHDCDSLKELGAGNGLRAPHYAVKPGDSVRLVGCSR